MPVTRSLVLFVEVRKRLLVRVSLTEILGVIRQFSACAWAAMHIKAQPSQEGDS